MTEQYTVPSDHLHHRQECGNIVLAKDNIGRGRLWPDKGCSGYSSDLLLGVPTIWDTENAGNIMWRWQGHVPSQAKPPPAWIEPGPNENFPRSDRPRPKSAAAVALQRAGGPQPPPPSASTEAPPPAAGDQPMARPTSPPKPRSRASSAKGSRASRQSQTTLGSDDRPAGKEGKKSGPGSRVSVLMQNNFGRAMEQEQVANYHGYKVEKDRQQLPLKFKFTKHMRDKIAKAREGPAKEPDLKDRWLMKKFQNVPSHFEQERLLATLGAGGRAASAPALRPSGATPPPPQAARTKPEASRGDSWEEHHNLGGAKTAGKVKLLWPSQDDDSELAIDAGGSYVSAAAPSGVSASSSATSAAAAARERRSCCASEVPRSEASKSSGALSVPGSALDGRRGAAAGSSKVSANARPLSASHCSAPRKLSDISAASPGGSAVAAKVQRPSSCRPRGSAVASACSGQQALPPSQVSTAKPPAFGASGEGTALRTAPHKAAKAAPGAGTSQLSSCSTAASGSCVSRGSGHHRPASQGRSTLCW
eukprot:TRINITY_DN114367_c0_g1_i1.p1 TRINITY_DN114367_c0_g1~~TRINITY_DN114367_c0_g1_i1.p1  ORF type:complete len:534 (+),score=127.43 TRINITY_DN114367_c0_g1_i1:132-1733(+)